jgi:hypothetical protein
MRQLGRRNGVVRVSAWAVVALAAQAPVIAAQPARPEPASAARPAGQPSRGGAVDAFTGEIDALWARLGDASTDIKPIVSDADAVFARAIAWSSDRGPGLEAMVRAAALRRATRQIASLPPAQAREARGLVATNRGLVALTAMNVSGSAEGGSADDLAGVYRTMATLVERFPDDLKDGSTALPLAAAICLVFDQRREHPTHGEHTPTPVEAFAHFRSNTQRLAIPVTRLPVRLLTWVVNLHCAPAETTWAVETFAGRLPGNLFDLIEYDTNALRGTREKKVLALGPGKYTLQNIRKVGGVCAEQAYFAGEVRKSLGIPAAFVVAAASDIAHAWAGSYRPGRGWDLEEGRDAGDGEYRRLTGLSVDPQTVKEIGEGELKLTVHLEQAGDGGVARAVALMDAADVVGAALARRAEWPPKGDPPPGARRKPRALERDVQLELLEASGRETPGLERLWRTASEMTGRGEVTDAQRRRWADMIVRMAGQWAPDFALEVLRPMIASVKTPQARSDMWAWAKEKFRQRSDLAAAAEIAQAKVWEDAKDPARAYELYRSVVRTYGDEGTASLEALDRAEALLRSTGKDGAVLDLLEEAFKHTRKPTGAGAMFTRTSNYAIVGRRLQRAYEAAGRSKDAERIDRLIHELGVVPDEKR